METTDIEKFLGRTRDAVRVLAFFNAKPGRGKELEKELQGLVALTRAEPGNIAYVLHRSTKNPDELVFDEIFASYAAFEEHNQQPYIKGLRSKIEHLLDAPVSVKIYSEVPSP
jgi:quinol monooxygenase YgiN